MNRFTTTLLSGLLCMALVSPGLAQPQFSAGGKFGLNFANWGGDIQNTEGRTALTFGGAFGADFNRLFGIEIDLLVNFKGASQAAQGVENKFKLVYLELPVLARLTVPVEGSSVIPQLYAGPALAIKLSCNFEQTAGGQSASRGCKEVGLETNALDFGVLFGGAVGFGVGPGVLGLDVRLDLGLTNVNSTAGSPVDIRNRVIQVTTGYMFPIGRR